MTRTKIKIHPDTEEKIPSFKIEGGDFFIFNLNAIKKAIRLYSVQMANLLDLGVGSKFLSLLRLAKVGK